MTDSQPSLIEQIAARASEIPEAQRASFISSECGDDNALSTAVHEAVLRRLLFSSEAATGLTAPTTPYPTPAPDAGAIPRRVGSYTITRVLGAGGMGLVLDAQDERLQRRVALKAIRNERRFSPETRARFLREARILSSLDHPHICRIYDYLEEDDHAYLVLEFIEGHRLTDIAGELTKRQRWAIAQQIASVLVAAHAAGVIHRDLKPDNLMITPSGEAKVLDFGIARPADAESSALDPPDEIPGAARPALNPALTSQGALIGTPMFMSPEQARGEETTTASDMHAFASLLQFLFTRTTPFPTNLSALELVNKARTVEPEIPASIKGDLARLIRDLRQRSPAARPTALQAAHRIARTRSRPRRLAVYAGAAAVLTIAALGAAKYSIDVSHQRSVAVEARADAEDLIGFMLQDLRDSLAPVGRLDALAGVAENVRAYYEQFDPETLDDRQLLEFSEGLQLIGEVALERGNLAQASQAFEGQRLILNRILETDPSKTAALKDLGAAEFYIGLVCFRTGNLDGAHTAWNHYLDLAILLSSIDPSNLTWRLEVAYAQTNLVALYHERGEHDQASRLLDESIKTKTHLVEQDPANTEWVTSLVNGLTFRADDHIANERLDAAETDLLTAINTLQPARDGDDTNAIYRLAICHQLLGELLMRAEGPARALAQFQHAASHLAPLLSIDPSNTTWRRELAVVHQYAAKASLADADTDLARTQIDASRREFNRLIERQPDEFLWTKELIDTELVALDIEYRAGNTTKAQLLSQRIRDLATAALPMSADESQQEVLRAALDRLDHPQQ